MLRDLYINLYGLETILPKHCKDLSARLSAVGGTISWRNVYSILKEYDGFAETEELSRVAQKVAGALDGSHPWQTAKEITVLSPNGVEPGSVITGHTIYCPGCGVKFVPDYGSRKWCHICRPKRKRK